MNTDTVYEVELPGVALFKRGKVRDIYDLGRYLLVVATDRLSAFDVVLPDPIPGKGQVLTALSRFWFGFTAGLVPNHLVDLEATDCCAELAGHAEVLNGRSMIVRKAEVIPIECVVRGYLAGSGWREYQEKQSVCGIVLPPGLVESDRFSGPLFTPATKSERGHDENISLAQAADLVGAGVVRQLEEASLRLYQKAADYAKGRGILLADTKFEFGWVEGQLTLVDEVLTPDSSRFWPAAEYAPGRSQPSFDKQFVRDYLDSIGWNREPPAPHLPEEIIRQTSERYRQALRMLVGGGES